MNGKAPDRACVIGAGGWGTALATVLARKGIPVLLWAREADVIAEINHNRRNTAFLPGVELPEGIEATGDLAATAGHSAVVMAVPSQGLRGIAEQLRAFNHSRTIFVSVTKGFEISTGMRPSEILKEAIGISEKQICILTGPSHAEEVAIGSPTAVVAASTDDAAATMVQELFFSPRFRVYSQGDPLGAELGGALKNIIAIACGISEGLGFGDNCQAAIITRGLTEITRLACSLGAKRETFGGLAGIGDLVVTCTSRHSRNRRLGVSIGQGNTLSEALGATLQVAEGVYASRAAKVLSQKIGVEMPIADQVRAVLFDQRPASQALEELLARGAKSENERGVG